MSGFRAIYVPFIFLLPWIGVPAGLYFGKIKPTNELWDGELKKRNDARGGYGSDTAYEGLWPPTAEAASRPKFQAGAADQAQDVEQSEARQAELRAELVVANAERQKARDRLNVEINARMGGLDRDKINYEKPDEMLYEILREQRDEEGPHLIRWLENNYKGLFFVFSADVPAPPFDAYNMPAAGIEGRLEWPIGKRATPLQIYGPLDEILDFVETFPDRYDRTAQLTGFSLTREAFDYRGKILMRLDTTLYQFIWPEGLPMTAPAAAGAAPSGTGGGMPMMPGPAPGGPGEGTSAGATLPSNGAPGT